MKKFLTLSLLSIGIFALSSLALASPAEDLQPASMYYIHDDLQVLGTARAYSLRVGAQGYGGVTFFNGTIINETTDTDTGEAMPVTFGDDVRIDGLLFRTEIGGDNPIKLADTIKPETTATYDLGTSANEFRHGYFSGNVAVGNLVGTGIVDSTNIANETIVTADLANNAVTSAKIASGTITGSDISSSADLNVDTGIFAGDITANGDINQAATGTGALKASVYVIEGLCSSYWTYNDSAISCSNPSEGVYTITFDFVTNQGDRYFSVTPLGNGTDPSFHTLGFASASSPSNNVTVYTYNGTTGVLNNRGFILTAF
jgi:hypothetical protein